MYTVIAIILLYSSGGCFSPDGLVLMSQLFSISLSTGICLCCCYCIHKQVIVKKDGEIMLYCKGADDVIFDRLHPSSAELKELTAHHLNVSHILCLGD